MESLNYHHLLYFWVVAREGSIARACEQLQLSQPTISAQLKKLEQSLGVRLFRRTGRHLELTDVGHRVLRYADEIFTRGRELLDDLQGRPTNKPLRFAVGVPDGLSRLLVARLLRPVLQLAEPVQFVCQQGKLPSLLADLAVQRLDLVLSDEPLAATTNVRAFSHLLGESGIALFGSDDLAGRHRRGFPKSMNDAPLLLPTTGTAIRRLLDPWLAETHLRPRIVAECEDSALLEAFGQAGLGIFAAPAAMEGDVQRQLGVKVVGRMDKLRLRYYALSIERRLKHPAVLAISAAAQQDFLQPATP